MRVTWRMRFSETPDAYKELSRAVYLRTSTIAGEQMLIFASPTQANTGARGKCEEKRNAKNDFTFHNSFYNT